MNFFKCLNQFHSNTGGTAFNQKGNEFDQRYDAWAIVSTLFV